MQRSWTLALSEFVDSVVPPSSSWRLNAPWMRGFSRFWGLYLISGLIVAVVILPVLYLILRGADAGAEGLNYLMRPRTLTIVSNSLALVIAVMVSAAAIGVPFAWLTTRSNLPFRRAWLVVGLLPMVIPSYIGAITFVAVFGPVGAAQQLLAPFGIERLPDIYGFFGAWLCLTLFTYPYFMLPVRAALLNCDPAIEEAAHSLGLSRWQVFWRVTLPILRPALMAGAIMTALYTLSDFGAVMVMRYNAITRAIYVAYNSSFDRNRAALLALVLVALTVWLIWMEQRLLKKQRLYRTGIGTGRALRPVSLGVWMSPALLFMAVVISLGVLVPVGTLITWSLMPQVSSGVDVNLVELGVNAMSVSGMAALVVGLVALPIALLGARHSTRLARMITGLSYLGNVLPGLVIGLALVFFAANALPTFYQTMPLLILGYAIRFLPYSVTSTRSVLAQMNPALDDAARSLGLRPREVVRRVTMPLARAGIVGGMAMVFLSAMKELPTTLLLAPIGFKTLATRIWTAQESASLSLIGIPGLLLMAVSCGALALLLWRDEQSQR